MELFIHFLYIYAIFSCLPKKALKSINTLYEHISLYYIYIYIYIYIITSKNTILSTSTGVIPVR